MPSIIELQNIAVGYGETAVMHDLNFCVQKGEIFVVMGVNGCGKSTLLKSLIGLSPPLAGKILYDGKSLWDEDEDGQKKMMRRFGVLYQNGALWSSMSVEENVALPLQLYSTKSEAEIKETVAAKLSLVGLEGFGSYFPAGLSGGMRKRASLARAIALDPDIIYFDEPSAGLDPTNARKLDDLILKLKESTGATIVIITHDLASIFAVATNSVFLDAQIKTMIACGDPKELLAHSQDRKVIRFLTRSAE